MSRRRQFVEGPDPIDLAVGARIKARRTKLGLSLGRLAKLLGLSLQVVQRYERGGVRVSAAMLLRIAAQLDTTVAALVGEEGRQRTDPIASRLDLPGAVEVLAAFAAIKNKQRRHALLKVARRLAGADKKRRRKGRRP